MTSEERRVVFLGNGGGKTTLINALLGWDYLPQGDLWAVAPTWTVTEIRYGPQRRAVVHYRDPEREAQDIPWTELGRYVREPEDSTGHWPSPYEKVEVLLPVPLLARGHVLIDTPNWLLWDLSAMPACDRVAVVWDAGDLCFAAMQKSHNGTLSKEVKMLRERLPEGQRDVFMVVNYCEDYAAREATYGGISLLRRQGRDLFSYGRQSVLTVDAMTALRSSLEADAAMRQRSGIDQLSRRLFAPGPPAKGKLIRLFGGEN